MSNKIQSHSAYSVLHKRTRTSRSILSQITKTGFRLHGTCMYLLSVMIPEFLIIFQKLMLLYVLSLMTFNLKCGSLMRWRSTEAIHFFAASSVIDKLDLPRIMCLIVFVITLIGYTEAQPLYNDLSVDTTQACYKECYGKSYKDIFFSLFNLSLFFCYTV